MADYGKLADYNTRPALHRELQTTCLSQAIEHVD
jgi:hypothetical protein